MINILVTGGNGQLGNALKRASLNFPFTFTFFTRKELDFVDHNFISVLEAYQFDVLINCAAYTAVDKAEEDRELAQRVNSEAPGILAEVCKKKDAVFIHISTDYVYDGFSQSSPWKETGPVNPQSFYGLSKLKGEEYALTTWEKSLIIRTSWLYGIEGNNFVKTMLRLAYKNPEKLTVVYDQVGAPTFAGDLAKGILAIADSFQQNKEPFFGTYNYSNEGVCSWYDFAYEIFRLKGLQVNLLPILSEQYPTPAKRPHYSVLNKDKIKTNFNLQIPHWQESLSKNIDLIAENL